VTLLNDAPQDSNVDGLVVRLILIGSLTMALRVIGPLTSGAHLKESPALPELLMPPVPENVILSGFVDQRAFDALLEAKLTAA
jgi:hypothetical protein